MTGARGAKRRSKLWPVLFLCGGLFVLYNANLRWVGSGDTVATRFLPFSILLDHSLNVDRWVGPYLWAPGSPKNYFVTRARGHWMSSYPIITPLVVTPLYIVPSLWVARHQPLSARTAETISEGMEKVSAAFLAALSAGILFLALRKVVSPAASWIIALIYGAASNTWTISSQVLYTHPLGEVSFALLLWALLDLPRSDPKTQEDAPPGAKARPFGSLDGAAKAVPFPARGFAATPGKPRAAFWAGLALALAVADKPPNFVVALPVMVYFLLRQRDKLVSFFAPLAVMGTLVLSYNLYYFHNMFGAYTEAFQTLHYSSIASGFNGSLWGGMAGLTISPSRGLLIYMPWTIFAIWGAVRLWRRNRFPWIRYVIVGVVGLFLVFSKLGRWVGGWTWGPRYLTDLLPFLAFFLVAVWPEIRARRWLQPVFALTCAFALWVQVVGAWYFPSGDWNTKPDIIDQDPGRVWDWRDNELLRTWEAGPYPTHFSKRLHGLEHAPGSPAPNPPPAAP